MSPYIEQESRQRARWKPENPGELTYAFYRISLEYIELRGKRFATFAEVLGALTATSHELYRRHVAPYEDAKREIEGDVN